MRGRRSSSRDSGPALSRRLLWALVVLTAVIGLLAAPLTIGIEDEAVPQFIFSGGDEPTEAISAYAAAVGIDPADVELDAEAIEELRRRGIDPCPDVGPPELPADLAAGVPVECQAVDSLVTGLGFVAVATAVAALGTIIMITSGNRFGLLLILTAMMLMAMGTATVYSERSLVRPGTLPLGGIAALVASIGWIPVGVIIAPWLVLIFPTGRLPSHRWRWVPWVSYAAAAVLVLGTVLHPAVRAVIGLPLVTPLDAAQATTLFEVGIVVWGIAITAAFVSLLWRFVAARGEERQQLKWVAVAAIVAVVVVVVLGLASLLDFGPGQEITGPIQAASVFVVLPAAALASILRYRLYDIDRIINLTFVYGAVIVVLGAAYSLGVFVVNAVVGSDSSLGVAATTLAVAALFNPLRRRLQNVIDRVFHRSRYNARLVVENLTTELRDEVDPDQVVKASIATVDEAFAPSSIAVWVRSVGTEDGEGIRPRAIT